MKVRLIVVLSFLLTVPMMFAQESSDGSALLAQAAKLEAEGKWQQAVPLLEQAIQQQPKNTEALYKLGIMKSWRAENRRESLDLLARACKLSAENPEYCSAYAEVLSWNSQTRAEAVGQLSKIVAAHPEGVAARLRLAQIYSWSDETRPQALELYEQGLQRDPDNVELLVGSAEVLSWSGAGRAKAVVRYDQALQLHPNEVRALTGKAQLLAWKGLTADALALYNRALAQDPRNAAALRGKAEILNWKGRHTEARSLATAAEVASPGDDRARLEIARADIGLHQLEHARAVLADVHGNPGPGFNDTRQEVRRGLGTWMDAGITARMEHSLSYERFKLGVSMPVAPGERLSFSYRPTLYDGSVQNFNTNYFEAALDSEPSDKLTTQVQFGVETINNTPVNFDGGVDLKFKPVSSTALRVSFMRQPVEESVLSRRGLNVPLFQGQVRANLAAAGIGYYDAAHKMDYSFEYTDGVYAGERLSSNRRYSAEAQIGKALRGDHPYIRLAYDVNYTSFDHDADLHNNVTIPGVTGGYFSPTRFLLNQGVISLSHAFNNRVNIQMNGTAGVQNVEVSGGSFSNTQFASSFNTRVFWRVTPMNELRFGYEYLNVYNAFDRNLYTFSLRHYF